MLVALFPPDTRIVRVGGRGVCATKQIDPRAARVRESAHTNTHTHTFVYKYLNDIFLVTPSSFNNNHTHTHTHTTSHPSACMPQIRVSAHTYTLPIPNALLHPPYPNTITPHTHTHTHTNTRARASYTWISTHTHTHTHTKYTYPPPPQIRVSHQGFLLESRLRKHVGRAGGARGYGVCAWRVPALACCSCLSGRSVPGWSVPDRVFASDWSVLDHGLCDWRVAARVFVSTPCLCLSVVSRLWVS